MVLEDDNSYEIKVCNRNVQKQKNSRHLRLTSILEIDKMSTNIFQTLSHFPFERSDSQFWYVIVTAAIRDMLPSNTAVSRRVLVYKIHLQRKRRVTILLEGPQRSINSTLWSFESIAMYMLLNKQKMSKAVIKFLGKTFNTYQNS